MHFVADAYIVIAVDPEHLLGYICFAGDINAVSGNLEGQHVRLFSGDMDVKAVKDCLDCLHRYLLADQPVHAVKGISDNSFSHRGRVDVNDVAGYLSAGEVLHQHGSPLQGIKCHFGISASLKPI